MSYLLLQGDAVHLPLPDRSVDLVFGSPPYIDARSYGIKAQRACQEWIDWMLVATTEACRVSRGLVLWVCASGVRNRCYQPAPEGLLYEWWRCGGQCWRPAYWYRSGIPGSGGQHWLRADVEYVLAFLGPDRRPHKKTPDVSRKERKKAVKDGIGSKMLGRDGLYWDEGIWTDNTAMGHEPKFAPGGNFSNRQEDGEREDESYAPPILANPGNLIETEDDGVWTDNTAMGYTPKRPGVKRAHRFRRSDGLMNEQYFSDPELSNPGNLIKTPSGFGSMGSSHAHDNEAPFPEALAEFFIKTACKPGGICLDPFSGSGTTVAVTERLGRHGIGLDIRYSQAELAERRITRPHSERKRMGRLEKSCPLFGDEGP